MSVSTGRLEEVLMAAEWQHDWPTALPLILMFLRNMWRRPRVAPLNYCLACHSQCQSISSHDDVCHTVELVYHPIFADDAAVLAAVTRPSGPPAPLTKTMFKAMHAYVQIECREVNSSQVQGPYCILNRRDTSTISNSLLIVVKQFRAPPKTAFVEPSPHYQQQVRLGMLLRGLAWLSALAGAA